MVNIFEIIGLIAGIITTGAFVPQVYKTWKTKTAKDISLVMYLAMFTGIILWLVYGIYLKSYPMILANSITATLNLIMIVFKLRYK